METPIGRLAAKGIRVSDILGFLMMLGILAIIGLLFQHKADAKEGSDRLVLAIRVQTVAICILSMPVERRRSEFDNPNSFCRRMVDLP